MRECHDLAAGVRRVGRSQDQPARFELAYCHAHALMADPAQPGQCGDRHGAAALKVAQGVGPRRGWGVRSLAHPSHEVPQGPPQVFGQRNQLGIRQSHAFLVHHRPFHCAFK